MPQNSASVSFVDNFRPHVPSMAILPEQVEELLGIAPIGDFEFPNFLNNDERQRELYRQNIGVIQFAPLSAKAVTEKLTNKQAGGQKLMYEISWYKDESFWIEELPRTGSCLVLLGNLEGSKNLNFLQQTHIVANAVESFLPELKSTPFWENALVEFKDNEHKISNLMKESEHKEAISLLQKLIVNKMFRPRFSEIHQEMVVYDKLCGLRLFESDYAWSNSATDDGSSVVGVGDFGDFSMRVGEDDPSRSWSCRGCSFLCSLEELMEVL